MSAFEEDTPAVVVFDTAGLDEQIMAIASGEAVGGGR
jgi:hypothetical protein